MIILETVERMILSGRFEGDLISRVVAALADDLKTRPIGFADLGDLHDVAIDTITGHLATTGNDCRETRKRQQSRLRFKRRRSRQRRDAGAEMPQGELHRQLIPVTRTCQDDHDILAACGSVDYIEIKSGGHTRRRLKHHVVLVRKVVLLDEALVY